MFHDSPKEGRFYESQTTVEVREFSLKWLFDDVILESIVGQDRKVVRETARNPHSTVQLWRNIGRWK